MTTNEMQLYRFIYLLLVGSTYLGLCLGPLSGALDFIYSFSWCPPILLPAGVMGGMELSQVLLMMCEDIVRNMQSWLGLNK